MAVKNDSNSEPAMRRPFDDEVRDPYEDDDLRDPYEDFNEQPVTPVDPEDAKPLTPPNPGGPVESPKPRTKPVKKEG